MRKLQTTTLAPIPVVILIEYISTLVLSCIHKTFKDSWHTFDTIRCLTTIISSGRVLSDDQAYLDYPLFYRKFTSIIGCDGTSKTKTIIHLIAAAFLHVYGHNQTPLQMKTACILWIGSSRRRSQYNSQLFLEDSSHL